MGGRREVGRVRQKERERTEKERKMMKERNFYCETDSGRRDRQRERWGRKQYVLKIEMMGSNKNYTSVGRKRYEAENEKKTLRRKT